MRIYCMHRDLGFGAGVVDEYQRRQRPAGQPPMDEVFTVIHVLAGSGVYHDARECWHLRPGDCLLRDHRIAHHLAWSGGEHQRRAYLILPRSFITGLTRGDADFWTARRQPTGPCDAFMEHARGMLQALRSADAAAGARIAALACHGIGLLTSAWHHRQDDALVVRAMAMMRAHPELALPIVARQLGVGASTLRRRFGRACGMSPSRWRIVQRVDQACELLSTGLPSTTVADRLGYADASAFARQFRALTGVSPRSWRAGGQ